MADYTMYPEFVADQVLTADHLNELFNYLDEQDRLTRSYLIGIGIVCGLDCLYDGTNIQVTKGVGVTSLGYLIRFDLTTFTSYRTYKLPASLNALTPYNSFSDPVYQLIKAADVQAGDSTISTNATTLANYVVILFLEADAEALKNCTTNDCDDKGVEVTNTVRALLVSKKDMAVFPSFGTGDPGVVKQDLPDLVLRRYNIPHKDLTSQDAVLKAFQAIVTPTVLKQISDAYVAAYTAFKPYLGNIATPFSGMYGKLFDAYNKVSSASPAFWQYFYDFVDDLVKAYRELILKGNAVLTACCPDENLFPYHLALAEATVSSTSGYSSYRNYFIYSPLFNDQKNKVAEMTSLFTRMKALVDSLQLLSLAELKEATIRITPSRWGNAPLSDRAIPFYYKPSPLYTSWSYDKTSRGKAKTNLSYRSDSYNTAPVLDYVKNPLSYELEPFDFFRIEGHVGKDYATALTEIVKQRDQFSLPFDVLALNVRPTTGGFTADDITCYFKDLETLYTVLISELLCKAHHPVCMIAGLPLVATSAGSGEQVKATIPGGTIDVLQAQNKPYVKGTFLKTYCNPTQGSIGDDYLKQVAKGGKFSAPPDNPPAENISLFGQYLYTHFYYFIDTVEELAGSLLPNPLVSLGQTTFDAKYDTFQKEAATLGKHLYNFLSLLQASGTKSVDLSQPEYQTSLVASVYTGLQLLSQLCIDEQIDALLEIMDQRISDLQLDKVFSGYSSRHPGLDHKAGVPRAGTFILVYSENNTTPTPPPSSSSASVAGNAVLRTVESAREQPVAESAPNLLAQMKELVEKFPGSFTATDLQTINKIGQVSGAAAPAPPPVTLGQRVVFADFFMPYQCCSECAPISYVLQEVKPTAPTVDIMPKEFCNDTAQSIDVSAGPAGGVLSGPGVVAGQLKFNPQNLPVGNTDLVYTMPDGQKATVTVKIEAPKKVDFDMVAVQQADQSFAVTLTPKETDAPSYAWMVDNTPYSTQIVQDTFTFTGSTRTLNITLTTSYGACPSSSVSHTLTLTKKAQEMNVKMTYCFATSIPVEPNLPLGNKFTWIDKGGLTATDDGVLQFAAGALTMTQTFTIKYSVTDTAGNVTNKTATITIVVVTPKMNITLTQAPAGMFFTLKALNTDITSAKWTFVAGGQTKFTATGTPANMPIGVTDGPVGTLTLEITTKTDSTSCTQSTPVLLDQAAQVKIRQTPAGVNFP